MKSWEPPAEFERADFPRKKKQVLPASPAKTETGKQVKAWRPRSAAEASASPQATPARTPSKSEPGAEEKPRIISARPEVRPAGAAVFLGPAILASVEEAAALLRSLYWDKKDTVVGGKRRIKVILTFAGPLALKALRNVLTPMERTQFAELARTEKPCDSALSEEICSAFIARLRHM